MNFKLLTPSERERYKIEHSVDGLLRGDTTSRYAAYAVGRTNGWLSADDIRGLENMDPLPDGQGEVYLVPLNMQPAAWLQGANPNATRGIESARERVSRGLRPVRGGAARKRHEKAFRKLIEDAATRVVKRESNDLLRELNLERSRRDMGQYRRFVETFYDGFSPFVRQQMAPSMDALARQVAEAAADEIGVSNDWTTEVEAFARNYLDSFTERYISSHRGQLNSLMDGEDPAGALETRLNEWTEKQPAKTSLNESVRLAAATAMTLWGLAGIQRTTWRNTGGDSCPYCTAMDGKTVDIGRAFVSAGDSMDPAGGNGPMKIYVDHTHPPLHEGCECMVTPG